MLSAVERGIKIKDFRKSHGYTLGKFAELLGISKSAISAYERGKISPSIEVYLKISNKYNVSIDWLCGIETDSRKSDTVEA